MKAVVTLSFRVCVGTDFCFIDLQLLNINQAVTTFLCQQHQ